MSKDDSVSNNSMQYKDNSMLFEQQRQVDEFFHSYAKSVQNNTDENNILLDEINRKIIFFNIL